MDDLEKSQILYSKIGNQSTDEEESKIKSRKRKFQSCNDDTNTQVKKKPLEEKNDADINDDVTSKDVVAKSPDCLNENEEETSLSFNSDDKEIEPNTDDAFEDLMTTFADDFKDCNGENESLVIEEKKVEIKPNTDEAFEDLISTFNDDLSDDKVEVSSTCKNKTSNEGKAKKNIEKNTPKVVEKKSLNEKKLEMTKNIKKVDELDFPSYDSFFKIRIKSPKIETSIFETMINDMNKVLVKDVKKTNKCCDDNYVTMGVIIEKSECKVSGNGKNYVIWKVNGFKHLSESSIKVLLFGDCFKSYWKLQEGMTVAILKPTFSNSDKNKDNITTLMVTKDIQVIELGFCIDFGICKSTRTDGKPCSNVINVREGLFCAYHLDKHARVIASRRGTFNSMYAQPNVKIEQQKLTNCHASPIKKVPRAMSSTVLPVRKINGALPNKDNIHLLKEQQKKDILMNASKSASCSLNARAIIKKQQEKVRELGNDCKKKKKDNVEDFISKLREKEKEKEIEARKNPMIGRSFKGKSEILL